MRPKVDRLKEETNFFEGNALVNRSQHVREAKDVEEGAIAVFILWGVFNQHSHSRMPRLPLW